MAFADFQKKQVQGKQQAVVREFFSKHNGHFIVVTDDQTFLALLRSTVKSLALNKGGLIDFYPDPSKVLKALTDDFKAKRNPALFIERTMSGTGETTFLIKQFRESFPQLRIFAMTNNADKGRLMLLHEAGADSFLIKPISGVDLMEKMAVSLKPPSPIKQMLDTARTFIMRNIGIDALKITRKVLEVKPDSAAGYVVMGDALRLAGDQDKAQVAYERASKQQVNYMEPLQKLADLAREKNDADMQYEYLKRLDDLSPLNSQRKMEMAELQMARGNTDAAKELFDGAMTRTYKDAMQQVAAVAEKIAMSLQESDPVQAEKYLRKCLDLKGDDLSIDDLRTFNQLGISLRRQGKVFEAIKEYQRALKIAPDSSEIYYNMAMAYFEHKDKEQAVRSMLKAFSLNPSLPNASASIAFNMGRVFAGGITKDKAKGCLQIAISLDPDFPQAKELLGRLKAEEAGQAPEAEE